MKMLPSYFLVGICLSISSFFLGCGLENALPSTKDEGSDQSQGGDPDQDSPGFDAEDDGQNPDPGYDGQGIYFGLEPMSGTIKRSVFDLESDKVILAIEYYDCEYARDSLKIELKIEPACGESYPLSCHATLLASQKVPANQQCKSAITTEVIKAFSVTELASRPASLGISGADDMNSISIMVRDDDSAIAHNLTILETSFDSATKELKVETQHNFCDELSAGDVYLDVSGECATSNPPLCSATLKVSALRLETSAPETCVENIDQTLTFWLPNLDASAQLQIKGEGNNVLSTVTLD